MLTLKTSLMLPERCLMLPGLSLMLSERCLMLSELSLMLSERCLMLSELSLMLLECCKRYKSFINVSDVILKIPGMARYFCHYHVIAIIK